MIEFSHVSKLFGAQKAVNDLNLNFQEGSFSVLIGTSGSGKSTTLKMINRLVEHDSGVIRFAGEEIRSLPVLELRRRMGYAIQSIGLFPHWSVAQKYCHRAAITKMVTGADRRSYRRINGATGAGAKFA
ncbi:ABC transporter ATP-binding protein [Escherichia coli]|uniref:ABC transporter ATP-binding protein n=1 Tax=Escherichia coli TaxID=562 RepID=A0A484X3Y6_ECOLX|nr:ABC transporter ATP-binding protein [Escherichia coli]